ncbi:MAG: sulfotransferase domain-containing protein [Ahrensia sp.]
MIVWLASYPRSGNTLLRIWLQKFFGLQSYSQYNDTTDIGADQALADTVGHVTFDGDWQAFKAQSEASDELVLVKTHDVPGDHGNNFDGKTIYVVRDGRSVAVSYLNYLNRFSQMEHDLADVVAGSVEFGNWADHLAAWEPKSRPDTLFLSYEEMLADSQAAIREIGEFLGRQPLESAIPEFKELQKLKPEFFRSGSNSSNLAEIDPDDKAFMLAKFGPALKEYGYIKSVRYDKQAAARVERNHERKMVAIKRKLAEAANAGGSLTALETQNLIKRIDRMRSEFKSISETQGKRIDGLSAEHKLTLETQGKRIDGLSAEHKVTLEAQGARLESLWAEQKAMAQAAEQKLGDMQAKLDAAHAGLWAMTAEYDKAYAIAQQQNKILQPSLKALLKMRAARYVWRLRNKIRAEGGSPPAAILKPSQRVLKSAGTTLPKQQPHAMAAPGAALAAKPIPAGVSAKPDAGSVGGAKMIGEKMPLGIAVYTFDRHERVHDVLESLAQQNALDDVHVFIDGDQGKPKLREKLERTEEFVRRYPVRAVHRNRGNFGFRKMMITSQRYMLERYDKIIFLEDDCFPTRNAVAEFSRELDAVRDNDTVFSVYGHPFKVKGEGPDFGRFQGWGWATTSDKLLPVWRELLDLYMLNEEEYLAFVDEHLTDDVLKRLDLTPGRQPSKTIRNFFAWDEVLAMICAMKGLTHKMADTRLIYNCGLGEDSAHFVASDVYLKPPFNMVYPRDVWDHF